MKVITLIFLCFSFVFLHPDGVEPIGSGTEEDPYQIEILENLLWVSTNSDSWDKYFFQINNIDASDTENWNGGEGFSPIGNIDIVFSGHYDGNDHTISYLTIDRPGVFNQAFLGRIMDGSVENLNLSICNINGSANVGILIGYSYNSMISGCSASGTVIGSVNTGGLAGITEYSSVQECSFEGSVTGTEFVGGLIGQFFQSYITGSYTSGSVEAFNFMGGFLGLAFSSEIDNCYSHCSIAGDFDVGGLVG